MTPYDQEQARLRSISAQVQPQDIWARVYSAVYVELCFRRVKCDAGRIAAQAADEAVQQFEEWHK